MADPSSSTMVVTTTTTTKQVKDVITTTIKNEQDQDKAPVAEQRGSGETEPVVPVAVMVKSTGGSTGEDGEYPAQPTMFYFALKFLIGLLTFGVVSVAIYFGPSPCEGICWMEVEGGACGPRNPLKLLFHRIEGSTDEQFLAFARQSQARKGFSWLSIITNQPVEPFMTTTPGQDLQSLASVHVKVKEAVDHIPWKLATRSNHTLFEGSIPVIDWSNDLKQRVTSIALVRNPRDRLREMYDRAMSQLTPQAAALFESITTLKSAPAPSFEDCLMNEKCRETMQLPQSCQGQTVSFCGIDCLVHPERKLTDALLDKAKDNLSKFLLVGIVEDPNATATILRKFLPTYFEYLPSNFTLNHPNFAYSSKASAVLDDICRYDDILYAAAVDLFKARAMECNINVVEIPVHHKRTFSLW